MYKLNLLPKPNKSKFEDIYKMSLFFFDFLNKNIITCQTAQPTVNIIASSSVDLSDPINLFAKKATIKATKKYSKTSRIILRTLFIKVTSSV